MVDVNALLQGLDEQGALTPLRVGASGIRTLDALTLAKLEELRLLLAGTIEVDTSLAPVLAAGLDVRVVSQPAPRSDYPLPSAQVDALKPLATQPVSGSVTASVSNFPATQQVAGTVELGATSLAALEQTTVTVSGTVSTTGPLTDAQLRAASVPVSGPLTDTQLRATPVPISGTVTATPTGTQAVSGAVDVTDRAGRALGTVSTGLAQPLTDTQLRATPVPVTGSLALSGATDVSDRAARLLGRVEVTADRTLTYYASAAGGRVAYNSFAERTGLANGTEVVIGVLLNPTGSGRDLFLDKRALSCSQLGRWVRLRGASLTLPVGGRQPVENRGGGSTAAVGEMILGSTVGLVVTGGSVSRPNYLPANADEGDEPNGSIVLRPGDNLVWRYTPGAANANASLFVAWHELPATA